MTFRSEESAGVLSHSAGPGQSSGGCSVDDGPGKLELLTFLES